MRLSTDALGASLEVTVGMILPFGIMQFSIFSIFKEKIRYFDFELECPCAT